MDFIHQHLQVATYGGLRKLHDAADFTNAKCMLLKQKQDAAPGGVGQGGELSEDGGGGFYHPIIRIIGWSKGLRQEVS